LDKLDSGSAKWKMQSISTTTERLLTEDDQERLDPSCSIPLGPLVSCCHPLPYQLPIYNPDMWINLPETDWYGWAWPPLPDHQGRVATHLAEPWPDQIVRAVRRSLGKSPFSACHSSTLIVFWPPTKFTTHRAPSIPRAKIPREARTVDGF
jgi:hypothetical protein